MRILARKDGPRRTAGDQCAEVEISPSLSGFLAGKVKHIRGASRERTAKDGGSGISAELGRIFGGHCVNRQAVFEPSKVPRPASGGRGTRSANVYSHAIGGTVSEHAKRSFRTGRPQAETGNERPATAFPRASAGVKSRDARHAKNLLGHDPDSPCGLHLISVGIMLLVAGVFSSAGTGSMCLAPGCWWLHSPRRCWPPIHGSLSDFTLQLQSPIGNRPA